MNPQNDFEIIKKQTHNINSAFEAISLAQKRLNRIKELANQRATGQMINIKELASIVISAKGHLTRSMIGLIESQVVEGRPCQEK